ncbi:M20 aminoacylase family protein [Allosediminivita pacifica]|uniref:Hippurate hydrolase n=1 Tax=Allosediminivita pacifica TaxID=1267769 RepID=A0A2T6AY97_9RHOB|nr:M20 aminoacylase family protein [Allosediminivita pacifica]PTX48769.1 hippurate hydrolase [Allosediminivita pacifica]GGB08079.1 amidohydrolase [Allosediminivita pacifica]
MTVIPAIEAFSNDLIEIRHDLHANPELGFEEARTAGIVASKLREYGIDEVHEGIGGTGVVGVLRGGGGGNRCIGLRADMDALPITEDSGVPYASQNEGRMHACGHDGHTTMLLGAARYLAQTRAFDGTVVFIFQPAEEGLGGARRMIAEGLFDRFPCDELYGMHNDPTAEPGFVGITPGPGMAGASFFDITIRGTGSHAAMPQQSKDPIVIGTSLVQQLQSVISRNVPPLKPVVLSVTTFNAGSAYNVVPDRATITGTIRYFHDDVIATAEARMRELCAGMAEAYGVEIDVDLRNVFDVLSNDPDLSEAYIAAAADVVGAENTSLNIEPMTGSEDFADMLKIVPGAYCRVGHAGNVPLHNPGFVLDDAILPVGASIYASVVERRLKA